MSVGKLVEGTLLLQTEALASSAMRGIRPCVDRVDAKETKKDAVPNKRIAWVI